MFIEKIEKNNRNQTCAANHQVKSSQVKVMTLTLTCIFDFFDFFDYFFVILIQKRVQTIQKCVSNKSWRTERFCIGCLTIPISKTG